MVPTSPKGTDTTNTSRHSIGASTPPRMRPRNEPLTAPTPLIPIARPRSLGGKASVMMALELANSNAPPTPWKSRSTMIHRTPGTPVMKLADNRMEKKVNTANPRLNIRARP